MSKIEMNDLCEILREILQIDDKNRKLDSETALLGCIPEFDSMAVVSVITAIEDNYGLMIDDDEVTAELFETIGTLHDFIQRKAG